MRSTQPKGWVWLPGDHRLLGTTTQSPFTVLGDKYAQAVIRGAAAQPVLFPLSTSADIPRLLAQVDGVMLTGSPSNVHPSHFGEEVLNPALPLDPARDDLTLNLVLACVQQGVPLLGVCRGFQEINVALGGSLHQAVQQVPGHMDHREDSTQPYDLQYAPSHDIRIQAGSALEQWAGGTSAQVNSLHGQGLARLAPGLKALAWAPDGLIEAFTVEGATTFAYAMQWHAEWKCWDNPFYGAIFQAFGAAVAQRLQARKAAS